MHTENYGHPIRRTRVEEGKVDMDRWCSLFTVLLQITDNGNTAILPELRSEDDEVNDEDGKRID